MEEDAGPREFETLEGESGIMPLVQSLPLPLFRQVLRGPAVNFIPHLGTQANPRGRFHFHNSLRIVLPDMTAFPRSSRRMQHLLRGVKMVTPILVDGKANFARNVREL